MSKTLKLPELQEGEIYVGAIFRKDGSGQHIILLPGDKDTGNWQDAMDWAKEKGGDLPNRVEQTLLYADHKTEFKEDWYWSNTTYHNNSEWAWCQSFKAGGHQLYGRKSGTNCRARAVRRLEI